MSDEKKQEQQEVKNIQEQQEPLDIPQEIFEPVISNTLKLDELLKTEATLIVKGVDGIPEITTCYGDIYKIVNAAMDYANLLEMAVRQWGLTGFHQAIYEYHAEKLREIAKKYGAGIGYDYDEAMKKCRQKKARKAKRDNDDVGEDAMVLSYRKAQREAEAKAKEAAERQEQGGKPNGQ